MTILQQYQFWVGVGLVLIVVLFFMGAFYKAPNMTPQQFAIIKILAALCAASAGALITGEALFKAEVSMGETQKYLFTGTAGFALFGLVWLIFPKYSAPSAPDSFSVSLPKGMTFRNAVKMFAELDQNSFAEFEGFRDDELNAEVESRQIATKTAKEAIRLLRSATVVTNAVRKYEVTYIDSTYQLRIHV